MPSFSLPPLQLTSDHLYLGEELQQQDEEAIIESRTTWWSQPHLPERGRKNADARERGGGPTNPRPQLLVRQKELVLSLV